MMTQVMTTSNHLSLGISGNVTSLSSIISFSPSCMHCRLSDESGSMKFTKEEKFAKSSLDTKDGMNALLQTKQLNYHASQVCLLPL